MNHPLFVCLVLSSIPACLAGEVNLSDEAEYAEYYADDTEFASEEYGTDNQQAQEAIETYALHDDIAVTMKHVRYCKKRALGVCTKSKTPDEFAAWKTHDVKDSRQKETYLATVTPGSKSAIENIVFLSAGQQGLDATFTAAPRNVVTGQPDDYRSLCKGKCFSKTVYIDGRSLASRLMMHPTFARSKTLYVLVFDAQFNHNYSASHKTKVERAFDTYIQGLVDRYRISRIIVGGSSRGGALAFRLAHRFLSQNRYPNAKIIAQGFDATFMKNQELGSTGVFYDNPLNSGGYKGRYADLDDYFARYVSRFASSQIVGGQEAVITSGARGSVYRSYDVDYGWWKQTWVDMEHNTIGRSYRSENLARTVDHAYRDILHSMNRLGI